MAAAAEDRLPEEELIAQMSYVVPRSSLAFIELTVARRTLTFAGMDTTSNALSVTLWRLAQNQDIQDRLRKEILEAQDGRDIPYDELVSLPLLDAICREILRLYVFHRHFDHH